MTHEHLANGEHADGPEKDWTLPPADSILVYGDPADSDSPPIEDD